MNKSSLLIILGPALTLNAFAEVYLTAEQAAAAIFPKTEFRKKTLELTEAQKIEIEKKGLIVKSKNLNLLVSQKSGAVVFVDQVIGKHEQITYAVGISQDGKIKGVEILEYRESYGHQIRRENWRQQFVGKDKFDDLKLNQDIKNISGATLSSGHVTEGVRRILQTYEQVKSHL